MLFRSDPFLALHNAAQITAETMIVADLLPYAGLHSMLLSRLVTPLLGRAQRFKPRFSRNRPWETWWDLPPQLVTEYLGVLGFEKAVTTYHTQPLLGRPMPMYTIVATRTKPTVPLQLA